ncbi:hypothetical protein LCGC14_1369360 [marine sediment metagenome]|uniref:Uncharacterized protein n=1 Tax=marine sediment metagenome TaxID=412755 RepID=A0A0F9KRQ9_9ZZZZ
MYPKDAITVSAELVGVTEQVFEATTDPKTILGVTMQQSGSQSDTTLICGTAEVAKNYNKDLTFVPLNYRCFDTLKVEKNGAGDNAFIILTYVPYDMTVATTLPFYINGFSYDGIFTGFVLFLMFMVMFFGGLWNRIDGVKKKKPSYNTYLGNNSEEGKIIKHD